MASSPLTTLSTKPLSEHTGLATAFRPDGMTIGAHLPLEGGAPALATMEGHTEAAKAAEDAGFSTLWVRDIPLYDRTSGDTAQLFDPFSYLAYLAALTTDIALGTAAVVLPLRHPLHAAKSAATIDQLSNSRFLFGVAAGGRASEFVAFGRDEEGRGEAFRESFDVISRVLTDEHAEVTSSFGTLRGADVFPKPTHEHIPTFVAGSSRQDVEWMAQKADGWMFFTLSEGEQAANVKRWRELTGEKSNGFSGHPDADPMLGIFKPFVQLTNLDLAEDPNEEVSEIHLGIRCGRNTLIEKLSRFEAMGVDQTLFGFRHSQRPVTEVMQELEDYVLPQFPRGTGEWA